MSTGLRERRGPDGWTLRQIRRAPDSYGVVLVLVSVSLALGLLADVSPWLTALSVFFIGATLTFSFRTSGVSSRSLLIAQIAWLTTTVLAIVGAIVEPTDARGLLFLLSAAILITTPFVILRRLIARREISMETVMGALSVYLIIGMVFAYLDAGVAGISSQPFFASGADTATEDFFYFSYITMTTVGYGDLSPVGNLPRLLAVFEALLGQLYLVTVVGLVVGGIGRSATSPSGTPPTGPPAGGQLDKDGNSDPDLDRRDG